MKSLESIFGISVVLVPTVGSNSPSTSPVITEIETASGLFSCGNGLTPTLAQVSK